MCTQRKGEEMNKRIRQKEETRQKILMAAKESYCNKGFQVATKDIALVANVSHGSIFAHFSTADLLCQEVLTKYFDDIGGALDECIRGGADLKSYLRKWLELIELEEAFYRRISSEGALVSEGCQAKIIGFQAAVAIDMERLIKKLDEVSPVKKLPLSFLVNTWLGVIHYYIQNREWYTPVRTSRKEKLVNQYLILIEK